MTKTTSRRTPDSPRPSKGRPPYAPGMKVSHPTHGTGWVEKVVKVDGVTHVQIKFAGQVLQIPIGDPGLKQVS
jgi:hypothetical protein